MDQRFLDYYNRELRHIRETAGEFAEQFPKIAGRLGMESLEVADPYVERLLEGFAFLAARVQLKIDSRFPQFTQHLLEIIYPHYQTPLPSMGVVQFQPDLNETGLAEGYTLPRQTALRSILGRGEKTASEFRTAHEVTLWPLEITEASYFASDSAMAAAGWTHLSGARAGIRLSLKACAGVAFNQLRLDQLTFYLPGGDELPMQLFEQILGNNLGFLVRAKGNKDAQPVVFSSQQLTDLGYEDEDALLPYPQRSFQGYRLLQEYFAFPQRFLFFSLNGLQRFIKQSSCTELEVMILLDKVNLDLQHSVDQRNFALNCSPMINLFPKRSDRIHLQPGKHEYHVIPDRTRPMDFEVYRIQEVAGYGSGSEVAQQFKPFYGLYDHDNGKDQGSFYSSYREPRLLSAAQRQRGTRSNYVGSEVFLSIVDAENAPFHSDLKQLGLQLLCSNRDLPLQMPLGRGRTDFTLDIGAPVSSIRCLTGPTKPQSAIPASESSWRFINHLTLNYRSLLDSENGQGAVALREILRLYANAKDPAHNRQIEAVSHINSKPVVRQLPYPGKITYGRGLQIALECDESAFEGQGLYLFGSVMERFFARYVSVNTFVETILSSNARGEVKQWPPRAGQTQLI